MSWRRRVAIFAILFLVTVAYYLIAARSSGEIPQSDVAKLEIELYPWLDDTRKIPGQSATVEDADRIAELLTALKSPELREDHKCGSRGKIRFT